MVGVNSVISRLENAETSKSELDAVLEYVEFGVLYPRRRAWVRHLFVNATYTSSLRLGSSLPHNERPRSLLLI